MDLRRSGASKAVAALFILGLVALVTGIGYAVWKAPMTTVVIPGGKTVNLQPKSISVFQATFQVAVQVSGSFSTSYSIAFAIVTSAQYAAYRAGSPLSYVVEFTAGKGAPTQISYSLQPGRYYFVIVNPWTVQSSFSTSDGIKAVGSH